MKAILTAIALTAAATGACAQEATLFDDHFVSQKTRAAVRAEAMAALARGEAIRSGEVSYVARVPASSSGLTRAQVHAETLAALARGDAIRYGEAPPAGDYASVFSGGPGRRLARSAQTSVQ